MKDVDGRPRSSRCLPMARSTPTSAKTVSGDALQRSSAHAESSQKPSLAARGPSRRPVVGDKIS